MQFCKIRFLLDNVLQTVQKFCTILREENEDVTDAFLRDHPNFHRRTQRTIWPQEHGTDGFYYCCMVRDDRD